MNQPKFEWTPQAYGLADAVTRAVQSTVNAMSGQITHRGHLSGNIEENIDEQSSIYCLQVNVMGLYVHWVRRILAKWNDPTLRDDVHVAVLTRIITGSGTDDSRELFNRLLGLDVMFEQVLEQQVPPELSTIGADLSFLLPIMMTSYQVCLGQIEAGESTTVRISPLLPIVGNPFSELNLEELTNAAAIAYVTSAQ